MPQCLLLLTEEISLGFYSHFTATSSARLPRGSVLPRPGIPRRAPHGRWQEGLGDSSPSLSGRNRQARRDREGPGIPCQGRSRSGTWSCHRFPALDLLLQLDERLLADPLSPCLQPHEPSSCLALCPPLLRAGRTQAPSPGKAGCRGEQGQVLVPCSGPLLTSE